MRGGGNAVNRGHGGEQPGVAGVRSDGVGLLQQLELAGIAEVVDVDGSGAPDESTVQVQVVLDNGVPVLPEVNTTAPAVSRQRG